MSIIGLDVGERRIGISVSDPEKKVATGLRALERRSIEEDIKTIEGIIRNYQAEEIVLGYPKNMDGSIGDAAKKVLSFGEELKSLVNLETIFWDERVTTLEAEKVLIKGDVRRKKRKKVIDTLSAILILQNYLDYKNT
ncbi:MAG: Holliday junction resolvase RuvX [bacterium]|nr:Holliday junction resolvase RuvX [bacterium]